MPIDTDDPDKPSSVLGRGKFGTVYRMINPHDQQVFAVKELTNLSREDGTPDEGAMEELLLEVRKLGTVNSEFVIKYHTSAIFQGNFYIVTELIVSCFPLAQCFPLAPRALLLFLTQCDCSC